MILKHTVKVEMPSLKRCIAEESLSVADEEVALMNPMKKRRDDNDVAGVSGRLVEAGVTPRVTRSLRERVHAPPFCLVDSVPGSSRFPKNNSVQLSNTEAAASGSFGPKLERSSPSFQLVYERRKLRKGPSYPVQEITTRGSADSDGLADVDISYDINNSNFSCMNHYVISTGVVVDIEGSKCLGLPDVGGGGRRGKECDRGQNRGVLLEEDRRDACKLAMFRVGDIVWAKSGRRYPAWPAIVINPLTDAPDVVLKFCIADTLCVMYFGFSENKKQRE